MFKRMILLLLAVSMFITCALSAQASGLSRAEVYATMKDELHRYLDGDDAMSLADLTAEFEALGAYKKSAAFSYYVGILRDTEVGDYTQLSLRATLMRLDEEFCELLIEEGFPTVDEVEAYALGRQAEAVKEWSAAMVYYEKSITVLDSMIRLARLSMIAPTPEPTPVVTECPHTQKSWQNAGTTYERYDANQHTVIWGEKLLCASCGKVVDSASTAYQENHFYSGETCMRCGAAAPAEIRDVEVIELSDTLREVRFTSNLAWKATESEYWMSLSKVSGSSGTNSLQVTLDKNTSGARTGRITISSGGVTKYVDVTQAASTALYDRDRFWVGATVEFGHYEQDGRSGNGKEAIEWIVLENTGSRALLLARYALDSKAYHDNGYSEHVTWSSCSLRTWLNNTFYRGAFSSQEQGAIRTTTVSTPYTSGYDTYPGPNTQDKVFLLSYEECQTYLGARTVYPTQYAISRGVMVRYDNGGTTYWWLRSPHTYGKVSVINSIGNLYGSKTYDADGGVRPVIWVDLNNAIFN